MKNKFPKFADVSSIESIATIDDEIFLAQKFLFELKIMKKNKEENKKILIGDMLFEPVKKVHYITFLKRRLTHLKYKRSLILKTYDKETKNWCGC